MPRSVWCVRVRLRGWSAMEPPGVIRTPRIAAPREARDDMDRALILKSEVGPLSRVPPAPGCRWASVTAVVAVIAAAAAAATAEATMGLPWPFS